MAIEVSPLHPTLGAEVRRVDLTRPMPPETFAEIEAAFDRHGILVFPEQPLTDEQQLAFSRRFGPLEVNPNYAGAKMRLRPDVADISNLDPEGRVLARDDRRNLFNLGNQLWHTDSSFKRIPAKCSLLSARELPSPGPMGGGETEFADLRAAWDALPDARQRELDGLVVEHSIFRSRSQIGFADFNDEILKQLPPVPQALVRHHPASGAPASISLARLAHHWLAGREGRALIEETDRLCDPAPIHPSAPLESQGPRHVGQSLHNASRPPHDGRSAACCTAPPCPTTPTRSNRRDWSQSPRPESRRPPCASRRLSTASRAGEPVPGGFTWRRPGGGTPATTSFF
jgi:alpha-ketoglutarate-dependent 2,4-dichlorophenoxyacetate dioxygenase